MKPIARTYLSLSAFYAADPRRRASRERDVGLWWRSHRGTTYRAAWVQDTGELYLFQHALAGPGGGSVHLVAEGIDAADLDARLAGWRDHVGQPDSLEWLLEAVSRPEPARTGPAASSTARAPRRPSGIAPERALRPGSSGGHQPRRSRMPA